MIKDYDLIVIGSGPGGYVAAIRASQLGMKVGIIEKESLGGVCLNWGCIPTKALLKSAQVWNDIKDADSFGINVKHSSIDFEKIINRSRNIAQNMSKGVNFLLKKNKIDIIKGRGSLENINTILVENYKKEKSFYKAKNIILATGAKNKELPNIKIDNKKIIGYRKAMALEKLPKSLVIIGAGAIGLEYAYFYNSLGTDVTVIEYLDRIAPLEDIDISKKLEDVFVKSGIKIKTSSQVTKVDIKKNKCQIVYKSNEEHSKEFHLEADMVLSAIGVVSNIQNIGLETLDIKINKDKVCVDEYYKTNIDNIYAIGDIIEGPALAHIASSEGIICVEKIAGLDPKPINYNNVPSCIYCQPEIASVGYTEKGAIEAGYDIKVGKFPLSASGKANASGHKDGFIKVIFDSKYGEWLGAHMIGYNVTELIAEVVVARNLETTAHEILKSIHPHPTISESLMEAVSNAYNECIHL